MGYGAALQVINANYAIKNINRVKNKRGQLLSMVSLIPLAACGGGTSPAPTTPTPEPAPDYTESPAGTFTGKDNTNLTLAQSSATTDLTVNSKDGNDTITTGSGHDTIKGEGGADTITSGDGNDLIRAGLGADIVDAGAGDDIIVIVGTTGAGEYGETSITNPAGSGLDISSVLTLTELNDHASSDAVAGETVDGGAGSNTLLIYGTTDLTGISISNITTVYVNSDVTFDANQLAVNGGSIEIIQGDGGSIIRISSTGTEPVSIDFSALNITDIGQLDIGDNVTLIVDSTTDLKDAGLHIISGTGTLLLSQDAPALNNVAITNTVVIVDAQGSALADLNNFIIVNPDQVIPGSGIQVEGNGFNQTLFGTQGNDIFYASSGIETFNIESGQDTIQGTISTLTGDTITDLASDDLIQIDGLQGYGLTSEDFIITNGGLTLTTSAQERTELLDFRINITDAASDTNLVVVTSTEQSITFKINNPPSFNHSDTIISNNVPGSIVELNIPVPIDIDGDDLIITITHVPTHTQIQLADGTILINGDTINLEQYQSLRAIAPDGYVGDAGSLHVTVTDSFGGRDDLLVRFNSVLEPSEILVLQEVTPLPDTVTGETPELVDATTYTIAEEEVFSSPNGVINIYGYNIIVNNAGVLWSTAGYTVRAYYSDKITNSGDIINEGGSGGVSSGGTEFTNSGLISVNSSNGATGVSIWSLDSFDNSGTIQVVSAAGHATGVFSQYASPTISNSGNVFVQGNTGAIAFSFTYFRSGGFLNDGVIIAESTNSAVASIAIRYGEYGNSNQIFDNSGFISADIAFQVYQNLSPRQMGNETFNNAGEIWGDFELGLGNETINNSGLIVGDIFFDEGDDVYNGSEGEFSGEIHGGNGDDTITGGAYNETFYGDFGIDIIDGGRGPDTLFGGANDDTLTGGSGNDYISGGTGNDTITQLEGDIIFGNSGNDTIILTDLGFTSIDGGEGLDILKISENLKADLSFTAENNLLTNINVFSLGANAGVALNVDMLITGETYKIIGENSSELLLLGSGWVQGNDKTTDGVTYLVYTNDGVTLEVQNTISTSVNIAQADGYSDQQAFNNNLPAAQPDDPYNSNELNLNSDFSLWDDLFIDENLIINLNSITTNYSHELQVSYFTIENHGTINITSTNSYGAIRGGNTSLQIHNYGEISLHNEFASSSSASLINSATVTNFEDGTISVNVASGDATVITSSAVVNDGMIISNTEAGAATSVNQVTTLYNTGTISASGTSAKTIIAMDNAVIVNDGTITAEATTNSIAISYTEPWSGEASWTITNSDTISADIAINVALSSSSYESKGTMNLINSGIITGNINLVSGDDIITNSGEIFGDISFGAGDDQFLGSDGTFSGIINGEIGNDTIKAGAGNATINGGEGGDILTGGAGDDVFVFEGNWGTDTVTDYNAADDTIDLSLATLSFADLTISQTLDGTLITILDGSSILLEGYFNTVDESDFIF